MVNSAYEVKRKHLDSSSMLKM